MRALTLLCLLSSVASADARLLNVSYDPTRELYKDVNAAFARMWQARAHERVTIDQSHGGSGKQARAVIEGLPADVVTLALAYDIDAIADKSGLIAKDWRTRLPARSTPYTSTVVLVVRHGNPRGIHDWSDLARPGVVITIPNPKTSGGARWAYLAAYGWAKRTLGNDDAAREYVQRLYRNAPVLDSGARASTTTFAQRRLGDVLVCWESEAQLVQREFPEEDYTIVRPSLSILAEPPVALVDGNVDRHGTRAVAQAYLEFLWSDEAQELAARHGFRPTSATIAARHPEFPPMKLFSVDDLYGSWKAAQKTHFADGGVFDSFFGDGS